MVAHRGVCFAMEWNEYPRSVQFECTVTSEAEKKELRNPFIILVFFFFFFLSLPLYIYDTLQSDVR